MKCRRSNSQRLGSGGSTLAETLIALLITAITVTGTVNGYIFTTTRAEWSARSLAANSMALQRMEQVRAAKWDPQAYPAIDLAVPANFPQVTNVMDLPVAGTNVSLATCTTTLRTVSANPPFKLVHVECVWDFRGRVYTNSVSCYRAPDQ